MKLYSWILNLFAEPGMKILDTHVGSASSLVACHKAGFTDVWGFEIDENYYREASARLDAVKSQVSIFDLLQDGDEEDQVDAGSLLSALQQPAEE